MAAVEIDETQLASLQNTTKIVQQMLGNPKHRRNILQAYKDVFPNANVPELEVTAPFEQRVSSMEKSMQDFIKEMKEEKDKEKQEQMVARIKAQQEEGRAKLKDRGYTEDGIKLVEEFRDKKGLLDYDDAIRLYELDNPPQVVSEPRGMGFLDAIQAGKEKDDFYKHLWESKGEDSASVDRAAREVIAEMRGALPRR